jgi:hypothetical protein
VEKDKHHELFLLIAIRNNSKIPTEEFCKLFDDNWHVFIYRFKDLEMKGLFMTSALEHRPGSYKYELTAKGNLRIMELLSERSNAIDLNLVRLGIKRDAGTVKGPGIFIRLEGFFTMILTRFKSKHPVNIELTITGKSSGIESY